MNQYSNSSPFLGLGCKAMKDVILKCNNRMSIKGYSMQEVERMFTGVRGCEYIEGIPERRTFQEASGNFDSLNLQDTLWYSDCETWWEHLEASYDRNQL